MRICQKSPNKIAKTVYVCMVQIFMNQTLGGRKTPHFPHMFQRACLPCGSGKANLFFIKPQQGKAGLYRSFIRLPSKSITSVIWPNIAGLIWTVVIVFGWNWNQVELQSYGQSWRSSLGQGIQCTTLVLLNLYFNSNIQGRHGEIFYPNFLWQVVSYKSLLKPKI